MKNKIKKFSKGDFQAAKPEIIFQETSLILTIGEGEVYKGYFMIKNNAEGKIRGIVYPSSFRMHCVEQGFEGNPVKVSFEYDGRGLRPGFVEHGDFTIVCTGGEYRLPFTAIIEKPYVMTNYGKVQNTDDFRKLAIKDYTEAQKLFRSREFYEVLKYEDKRIFHLYDNMRKWSLSEQAMEEFLVGIKQKECIFLTLPGEGMCFEDLKEVTKGTMTIQKNTWGFMPIQIRTEGNFITPSRPRITTDDFIGNAFHMEFLINPDKMHAGRNFGKIFFDTPYETLSYDVEVIQNIEYTEDHREIEFLMAQLLKEYISLAAGRTELDSWVESASAKTKKMVQYAPMDEFLQLLQAHVFFRGNRIEDAKWILENYNYNRFAVGQDPVSNAYYLYLTAKIRGTGSHVERAIDEIGKIYLRHQDSIVLLLILLDLDPQYQDVSRRLRALEQHYYAYEPDSVLFLLEAYLCLKEKNLLLKKLGRFEYAVINFAVKYRMMSREFAMYFSNLASQQKSFNPYLFRILKQIYRMYPETMILNTIVTHLIKGNRMEPEYFIWYQRAVNAELKIAQLYEYYMSTIDENNVREALPKSIFLYFMHGNNLNYRKAALLYANLVTYEEYASDLYISYREQMVAFAWDQLLKRHITESLKILYKKFCTEEEMTGERLEAMRDVCHAYEVKTRVQNLRSILVIEKDGSITQRVPVRKGKAVVYLYDKEARIIWEAKNGQHYTDSIAFETKRLFYEPRYLEMCKKYMSRLSNWSNEGSRPEVSFENIKQFGIRAFDLKDVFAFYAKKIREDNYDEDEFMLYLGFELFRRKYFDRVTLNYLSNYYCGSTRNMKLIWKTAKEHEVPVSKLGERIITQMLFSEQMIGAEEIFVDYYLHGNPYFRLKQAYLAYACKEYIVEKRETDDAIFEIILNEEYHDEDLADICKIALLSYFSSREIPEKAEEILHRNMMEMCEKQIIFPFYLSYKEEWLREMQLFDKTIISYQAEHGGKVKLVYKMKHGDYEELGYQSEGLTPMYANIYVKDFVLFGDESIRYSFHESCDKDLAPVYYAQEEKILRQEREIPKIGKYGKLYAMSKMGDAQRRLEMMQYEQELAFAEDIFRV